MRAEETKLAHPKNNKTVYSMALTEEEEYEKEYWEREERFLKMKLEAVQAIADSINNLAKSMEQKQQSKMIVINISPQTSDDDINRIKEMIECF